MSNNFWMFVYYFGQHPVLGLSWQWELPAYQSGSNYEYEINDQVCSILKLLIFAAVFRSFQKISRFIQTVKSQGWWAFVVLRTFLKSFIQIQIDKLHPQLFIFFSLKFRSRTTTFCRLMIESIHKLVLSFHWFRFCCLN